MLFLIKSLPELREGRWLANPAGSGYVDLPMVRKGRTGRHRSYFEILAGIGAEIEVRLEIRELWHRRADFRGYKGLGEE